MFFGFACNKLWSTHPICQEIVDFQFRAIIWGFKVENLEFRLYVNEVIIFGQLVFIHCNRHFVAWFFHWSNIFHSFVWWFVQQAKDDWAVHWQALIKVLLERGLADCGTSRTYDCSRKIIIHIELKKPQHFLSNQLWPSLKF